MAESGHQSKHSFCQPRFTPHKNFSPFIVDIVEFLVELHVGTEVLEKMDYLTNLLSFYRFLLIRDKSANFTGIWKKDNIATLSKYLHTLQKEITRVLDESKQNLSTQKATQEYVSEKYGLPEMTDEEFKTIKSQAETSLELLLDLTLRVKELIKGASPFTGKPG